VVGGAAEHATRLAILLHPDDQHGPDDERSVWSGDAADRSLISPVIGLPGLDLAMPDHSSLSRRAKTLEVPPLRRLETGPLLLQVDSTGLKRSPSASGLVIVTGDFRLGPYRPIATASVSPAVDASTVCTTVSSNVSRSKHFDK
jgi:Transposase DDE domain